MIEKLEVLLISHEGERLKPYRCSAGKLTIGVGRNIEDRGISHDEAMYLLSNDIQICIDELTRRLPWFAHAPETVQIVLIDMCFNLGAPRLMQFRRTLSFLEKGDYMAASSEMLDSSWAKQVGKRALTLSNMLKSLS